MKKTLLLFAASLASAANLFAESPYGLTVCGVEVNDENKGDIMAAIITEFAEKEGVTASGTMSYNSETQTLTMNDVTINGDSYYYHLIGITQSLTIAQTGNNELATAYGKVIYTEADLTITGEGTLTLKHTGNENTYPTAMYCNYDNTPMHTLTIEKTNINIEDVGGLWTTGNVQSKLVINESNVKVKKIETWREIELINCSIAQPSGAYMIENWCSIMCNGDYATDIVIVPTETTRLQSVKTNNIGQKAYNLNGQAVQRNQKGIVLKDGRCSFVK